MNAKTFFIDNSTSFQKFLNTGSSAHLFSVRTYSIFSPCQDKSIAHDTKKVETSPLKTINIYSDHFFIESITHKMLHSCITCSDVCKALTRNASRISCLPSPIDADRYKEGAIFVPAIQERNLQRPSTRPKEPII